MKTKRRDPPKRRCVVAHALTNPCFLQRKVRPRKGRGSYTRREKHRGGAGADAPVSTPASAWCWSGCESISYPINP